MGTPTGPLNWREQLPATEIEFAGRVSPEFSRQQKRAKMRVVAKYEVAVQKRQARKDAKQQKKRERAGLK